MSDPNVVAVEPALYGADQIKALTNIEGIRTRPAMYIGDTGPRGLHHLVYEVVDNCIDEALSGYGKLITVQINLDGSVTTADQGRGIPVGPMPDQGNKPALEVVLTSTHAGGKFDRKGGYSKGTGGLHGVGIKAVNALSEWLEVEVRRGACLADGVLARRCHQSAAQARDIDRNRDANDVQARLGNFR